MCRDFLVADFSYFSYKIHRSVASNFADSLEVILISCSGFLFNTCINVYNSLKITSLLYSLTITKCRGFLIVFFFCNKRTIFIIGSFEFYLIMTTHSLAMQIFSSISFCSQIYLYLLYLWEYFLYKIIANKHAFISNREIVSMLSAHGEQSSKLFTSSIPLPSSSFFNSEHL